MEVIHETLLQESQGDAFTSAVSQVIDVLDLIPQRTARVFEKEGTLLQANATAMKDNLKQGMEEVNDLKQQLEQAESDKTPATQKEVETMQTSLQSLEQVLDKNMQLLVHPDDMTDKLRQFQTKKERLIASLRTEMDRKASTTKESIRNMRALVTETSKALAELESDMDAMITQQQETWREIEREFNGTVKNVNQGLKDAANGAVDGKMYANPSLSPLTKLRLLISFFFFFFFFCFFFFF